MQSVKSKGVEVVFVSADKTDEEMAEYMKESHGDWYSVARGSDESKALEERFSVSSIPTLVVVNAATDAVISEDGTEEVQASGVAAYDDWKKKKSPKASPRASPKASPKVTTRSGH